MLGRFPLRRVLFGALVLSFMAAAPAVADDDQRAAREAVRRGDILPLAQVIEAATRRVPGEVIEVELDREDDGWEYEIKVLTPSGRVREITLNARTGAILEIEDD